MFLFQKNHIDQVKRETKTHTRRRITLYKKGKKKGQEVPFKKVGSLQQCKTSYYGPSHCNIRILRRWRERLGDIDVADAHKEGGYTPDEYIDGLIEMHKGELTIDSVLVCYEFELVKEARS